MVFLFVWQYVHIDSAYINVNTFTHVKKSLGIETDRQIDSLIDKYWDRLIDRLIDKYLVGWQIKVLIFLKDNYFSLSLYIYKKVKLP